MDFDVYNNLSYKLEIIEDRESGGYVASYPELKGCLSCGETLEKAIANVQDAKKEWLRAAIEDGYDIPIPAEDIAYSGQFRLRMPKSLHRQLAMQAKQEGVSMNQYCIYKLSQNN